MYLQFIFVFASIAAIIDFYFYLSIRQVVKRNDALKKVNKWILYTYWGFTAFTLCFLFLATYYYIEKVPPPKFARIYITGFIFIVILSKLFGIVFFIIDDIKSLSLWVIHLFKTKSRIEISEGHNISRGKFIKQSGLIASAVPFVTMMYGVVKSAFDFKVINVKLHAPGIPKQFNGFKIVQISDIHTGSFISDSPMKDAVKIINDQNADVIFFTGDLVNEVAEEALPFIDVLKNISAKHGVYSILGNHDYGDYFYQKNDLEGKKHNFAVMRDVHQQLGWDLLLNEHRSIENNGERINIIGVENWGSSKRFQKHGDVSRARLGMDDDAFKILLSHDPSHWDAFVRKEHRDIALTLSGHTHGFQLGIEIPGYIKWSPSKYLYKQWAGLYQEAGQWIYVNRGLGFLGYPGRLGMLPEITVIELQSTQA